MTTRDSDIDRTGVGDAALLWRNESSEAWLNQWWQPRDTGFAPSLPNGLREQIRQLLIPYESGHSSRS
jgi:hypothetical protein